MHCSIVEGRRGGGINGSRLELDREIIPVGIAQELNTGAIPASLFAERIETKRTSAGGMVSVSDHDFQRGEELSDSTCNSGDVFSK